MRDKISTPLAAEGRWPRILAALGFPKEQLSGANGPCIFCEGKDRARFTDWKDRGWYFCNQCGKYDGFRLVMKWRGWTFKQTADAIDRILGSDALVSTSKQNWQAGKDPYTVPRSTRQCALWLRQFHPERLEGWLDSHPAEVRFWLETQT